MCLKCARVVVLFLLDFKNCFIWKMCSLQKLAANYGDLCSHDLIFLSDRVGGFQGSEKEG